MRNLPPLVALLAFAGAAAAQSFDPPRVKWVNQFGTPGDDRMYTLSRATGGFYAAGDTSGSLAGPNLGSHDIYLARYTVEGTQLWARQIGSNAPDFAGGVAADPALGGVFMGGSTDGALAGPSAGSNDAIVGRWDNQGNQLWLRQFGTALPDAVTDVAYYDQGVMVAGTTEGVLGSASLGGMDAFLAKYSLAGTRLWLRQFGTSSHDQVTAVIVDGVYTVVAGYTGALSNREGFIAKYDVNGTQLWMRTFGSPKSDEVRALVRDGQGNYVVGGMTYGELSGPNRSGMDGFLAWFDEDGNNFLTRQFGRTADSVVYDLVADGPTDIYAAGWAGGPLGQTFFGALDIFVVRYDLTGNHGPFRQIGTARGDQPYALTSDGAGGVILGGVTQGDLAAANAGMNDMVLARFGVGCYADCNGDGVINLADFGCFQTRFAVGCP